MSFDVYFQRFANGDAVSCGNADARDALAPNVVRDNSGRVVGLRSDDGAAELHGLEEEGGFMATHITGTDAWNLLYLAASAGGFTVMPVGGPVCIPNGVAASDLPSELQGPNVRMVNSGVQLLAIATST